MTQKKVENSKEEINCQFCRETLLKDASFCRYCGREQFIDYDIIRLKQSNSYWILFCSASFPVIILFFVHIALGLMSIFVLYCSILIYGKIIESKVKKALKEKKTLDIGSLQRDNKQYKLYSIVVSLLLFLALLMFITNPQKKDLYEHIRAEHSILIKSVEVEIIEVKDYSILSFYSVDIGLLNKKRHYYFGILNRIFELDAKTGYDIFNPKDNGVW